ncbi:tRNA lysidine(34) synthetase TilS [Aquincola sp. S2]|uniref:tRNA(Ile)-lysidine synthase n=1 Tax=Pseudaquabacterium terrae TaxID=2732868 RepID=A0ABX2EMA3_9BURK|nr:tRNA lysidine(34) synthetase TilS [Aquabacterium terrae]
MAVAFSGGRDSLALLHATVRAAKPLGLSVVALHVHHGLQPQAGDWVRSAIRLCGRWQRQGWPVRLRWHRLVGAPAAGDSIEAWARRERYAALERMAIEEGASLVLLAQHRRDQAETVLLQALRGAGPRGLAAMPRRFERGGIDWARPWLNQPRTAIEHYVQRHRLRPIDDPSNADPRFARSRLRLALWPALEGHFPQAETALVAVAERAWEAAAALVELAESDLRALVDERGLDVAAWQALSPARRANALRHWLAGAPESLVQRLLVELPDRRQGAWPLDVQRRLSCYRGRLRFVEGAPSPRETPTLDLSTPGIHELPQWQGAIEVTAVASGGIGVDALRQVSIAARSGGESFQRAPRTPPRSLKKQYQQAGIAPDERSGPLLWSGDRLLFVPGLGIDARALAAPGAPQCGLRWLLHRSS